MGEAGFFGLFLMVGAVAVSVLVGPVGQAVARRIAGDRKAPTGGISTGEMAAEQVVMLEGRIQELEERLDFAERVLLKSGERRSGPESTPR